MANSKNRYPNHNMCYSVNKIIYFDIDRNLCKTSINDWINKADISFGMRYQKWQSNMNELNKNKDVGKNTKDASKL